MKKNCLLCKSPLDESEAFYFMEIHSVQCCDRCANKVVSAYNYWHGGDRGNSSPAKKKKTVITRKLSLQVFDRDGYQCLSCGCRSDLTVDHVMPESKGGPTEINNLQTLCRSCNSKKGVKNAVV